MCNSRLRVAEFFAGMGLVRTALEQSGFRVVFANDISPVKLAIYAANHGAEDFALCDISNLSGGNVPGIDLATASFPCTDLSVAGGRAGLAGSESGLFWQFTRILEEMGDRRPRGILLENVLGFATSRGGRDLENAIGELNRLGYSCDLIVGDGKWFVPQSRPRLFVVGLLEPPEVEEDRRMTRFRPRSVWRFRSERPQFRMHFYPIATPPNGGHRLDAIVERMSTTDPRWWSGARVVNFQTSLSSLQARRVRTLVEGTDFQWRTAYRRTRGGKAVWEVRRDDIAGCLRTARGGSSKQALVEVGAGKLRVRWLTPRECARLQGADDFILDTVTTNQALYGLGDAVCVPVVRWIANSYLGPLLRLSTETDTGSRRAVPV